MLQELPVDISINLVIIVLVDLTEKITVTLGIVHDLPGVTIELITVRGRNASVTNGVDTDGLDLFFSIIGGSVGVVDEQAEVIVLDELVCAFAERAVILDEVVVVEEVLVKRSQALVVVELNTTLSLEYSVRTAIIGNFQHFLILHIELGFLLLLVYYHTIRENAREIFLNLWKCFE